MLLRVNVYALRLVAPLVCPVEIGTEQSRHNDRDYVAGKDCGVCSLESRNH
jgi:hypothetical protein